jgi:hypothetical protein
MREEAGFEPLNTIYGESLWEPKLSSTPLCTLYLLGK